MKRNLLAILAVFSFALCIAQDSIKPVIITPPAKTVVVDSQIVGGQKFFVIADELNGFFTNIRTQVAPIIDNPPQKTGDWIYLILKLITGGVVTSIASQGVKIWKDAKALFQGLANEWIVLIVSAIIGAAWMYLDTKFLNFDFLVLFGNTAKVFVLAIVVWRAGLRKLFAKKVTAPAPIPAV